MMLMNAISAMKQNKIILNASVVVLKRVASVLIISILKMNHVARLVDWSACFLKILPSLHLELLFVYVVVVFDNVYIIFYVRINYELYH